MYHGMGIGLGQGIAAQLSGATGNGSEQRPLRIYFNASVDLVGIQIFFKDVMVGHLVPLSFTG